MATKVQTSSLLREVSEVDVMSVGKIYTVFGALTGLIIGVIYGLMFLFMGIVGTSSRNVAGTASGFFFILLGVFFLIGMPLLCAVGGFIGGLIRGVIYNWAAGKWGGIKVKLN